MPPRPTHYTQHPISHERDFKMPECEQLLYYRSNQIFVIGLSGGGHLMYDGGFFLRGHRNGSGHLTSRRQNAESFLLSTQIVTSFYI